MTKTVLILGASGKIGRHSAKAFRNAGWLVREYDRKSESMTTAAQGVDVIVNGLNPPNYHDWARLIPEITKQVIAAAKASGATVIIPGNVYNFGSTPGIWSENTPQTATTRKGKIRIEMEQAYRDAGVNTVILRAGNFIDPDHNGDVMSMVFLRSITKGKLTTPGRTDVMQAFCYLPDWARAAVDLSEIRDQLNVFEDVPFPGHAFTTQVLHQQLESTLKRKIKLVEFPWLVMQLASPFWELARELNEMRYLWNTAHQLDGTKFAQLLPEFNATKLQTVLLAGLPSDIHPNQAMPGNVSIILA
ncbi:MAG: epimerase [Paracoccaceae bacterium]